MEPKQISTRRGRGTAILMSNIHRKKRAFCEKCRVCFVRETEQQTHCCRCLVEMRETQIRNQLILNTSVNPKSREKKCVACGKIFYHYNKRKKTCSPFCASKRTGNKKTESKNPIEEKNKQWLTKEEPKKRKGKSLSQLNKESEYKRVFSDKGWDHYLKGRRYDKI